MSLRYMSRDQDMIAAETLKKYLTPGHVAFFGTATPAVEGAHNISAFIDTVFSR